MNTYKLLPVILPILILGACTNSDLRSESTTGITKQPVPAEESKNRPVATHEKVEYISIINSPEQKISPSKAAISQYQFNYKNKKIGYLSASSVINEVTMGDHSLVILDTKRENDNFVILYYQNEENLWEITNIISLNVAHDHYFTDQKGLNLPFRSFVAANTTNAKTQFWTFADKKSIAVIAKFPRFSFDQLPPDKINAKGREMFVSEKKGNSFLYYFDSGNLVVISGNINRDKMVSIANSLPPSNSSYFPAE